jgi:glutamate-1-semialdehyde 2,1-aminomutase
MERVAPAGDVYQAGTLSGNPLAVAAGMATLELLDREEAYARLERRGDELERGLAQVAAGAGVPVRVQRVGSMLCLYFTAEPVRSLADVTTSDRERWVRFFAGMLERGVLLPPSPYEAWFLSTEHDAGTVARVLEAAEGALAAVAR